MSRRGDIRLPFGPEERAFRLGIAQIEAIEAKCGAGIPEILTRLNPFVRAVEAKLTSRQIIDGGYLGAWRIQDLRETHLQGLIGGGMNSTEAGVLVRAVFDEGLDLRFVQSAFLILEAAWSGPPEDLPGERKATPKTPARRRSPKAEPASQP